MKMKWQEASVLVPEIDGYIFMGYDDCTKNLPCLWYDFVSGKLVEAKESEYPFYAMLYARKSNEQLISVACGEGHAMSHTHEEEHNDKCNGK